MLAVLASLLRSHGVSIASGAGTIRRVGRGVAQAWPGTAVVIMCWQVAVGQEALRTSMAANAAAQSQAIQPEALPYTFKTGDLRLRVVPSVSLDWNDNVNATKENAQDDFILRPMLGLN